MTTRGSVRLPLATDTAGKTENPEGAVPAPAAVGDLADLLVNYLEQLGVEYVFGVPGGHIEPLYNALARSQRRGGLRHILARHEAGAAYMADGYARETGRLGVCCSTAGPGATNLLTGVACAYENHIPLLVITGQSALPTFGRHPLQESSCTGLDILGMFSHCTRYNTLVSHPKQFEHKLVTALQFATRTPKGPVHLSLPADVFRAANELPAPAYDLAALLQPALTVDDHALVSLRRAVAAARKVVMVLGAGAAGAAASVLQYADEIGATVVTTPDGKGLVSPAHPLNRGVFGFAGHATAEAALQDGAVDVILAVGTSLGELNSGGWSSHLLNERLIHVDEPEEHLARTPMARLHVRGHLATVFSRLVAALASADAGEKTAHARRRAARPQLRDVAATVSARLADPASATSPATPVKPQRLMHELGLRCPPGTRFFADSGNSVGWAIHYLNPVGDRRGGERRRHAGMRHSLSGRRQAEGGWLRLTMDFAPMGWAIGAAIGTAAASRETPVVCITGDGSVLMNGQELSVAVAEGLSTVFVVLNDSSLGMVRHGQRLAGAEAIGCAMPATDFAALARALGAEAHVIHSPEDLDRLDLAALCRRNGPTLLDVRVDPEEVPPMNARMRVLARKEN
ncbi:MAG: Acetolactate synthase [Moraxellaceae bacterium]|jgi:acetolactate synthase-1/2/3 large subunit|nr:Acetolactate synthase [Moraxellaceae bacterium]